VSTEGQGYLAFLSSGAGMLAAAAYGFYGARRFRLRTLLLACLLFNAFVTLDTCFTTATFTPAIEVITAQVRRWVRSSSCI